MLLTLLLTDLNREGVSEIIGNKGNALYLLKHFPGSFYSIAICGSDYVYSWEDFEAINRNLVT